MKVTLDQALNSDPQFSHLLSGIISRLIMKIKCIGIPMHSGQKQDLKVRKKSFVFQPSIPEPWARYFTSFGLRFFICVKQS